MTDPIPHVASLYIRDQFAEGHPLRLFIDSTVEGVDCPPSYKKDFGTRLIIDLHLHDRDRHLEEHTPEAFLIDLVTRGSIWRCSFPWRSIWAVFPLDMSVGSVGLIIQSYLPADVRDAKLPEEPPVAPRKIEPLKYRAGGQPDAPRHEPAPRALRAVPRPTPRLRVIRGGKK
jgi:hypothetical protein